MQTLDFDINRILILGSGYIGSGVHKYLSSNFETDIFDKKDHPNKSLNHEDLEDYNLIIGCVGRNAIPEEQLQKTKQKLALMSASSSDREFRAFKLRSKLDRYHYFSRNVKIGNLHLVNSGFPVNFDDAFLDSRELELTRSLLFLAVMQAMINPYPRKQQFIDVDHQEAILQEYLKTYKEVIKQPLSFEMQDDEVNYPHLHKLLRALNYDAFSHFDKRISYHIQPHAKFETK